MKIETKFDIGDMSWHLEDDGYIDGSVVRFITYGWYGLSYQTDNCAGIAESNLFPTQAEAEQELERRAKK